MLRRLSHLGIVCRSIAACLSVLSIIALEPATLAAQTKSMTITGVAGITWDYYDPDAGIDGYTLSFTVKNTGTQAAYLYVTPSCGGVCNGSATGTWTWLTPGQTTTYPLWLGSSYAVTAQVTLTVVGYLNGFLSATDSKTVLVRLGPPLILTPPRPSDISAAPNGTTLNPPAGTSTFNFIITNNDHSTSAPYTAASMTLWLRCGGFVGHYYNSTGTWGSCGRYTSDGYAMYTEAAPFSATVTASHADTLPVTLVGTNGQRGTIWLVRSMIDPVTNAAVLDSSSVLVLIGDQIVPSVTPKGGAATVAPRIARVDSFTVNNAGTVSATYAMSATCGSFGASGCTASPSSIAIAAGASARVAVAYTPSATNGSTSVVKLVTTASATGLATQTDSGSITVTAMDAVGPVITVTPAQNSTLSTRTFTATVSVCDDGFVANPTITFNGVRLPDMFLRAPQAGCIAAGSSTFTLTAQPGTNTIAVTDGDGYNTTSLTRTFTYDDATEVTPQVAAVLSSVKVTPGAAWIDTFTVRNPGPASASYSLSGNCGSFSGCTAQPATLSVGPGQTLKATIGYTAASTAGVSSTIRLTATHTGANNHQVSASASLTSTTASGGFPQVTMTPTDGASYSAPTFTATVTWCDADDAIASRQVWLGGTLLPNTFVAQTVAGCVSAGTSTWTNLTLVPWDQVLLAQATDAAGHVTRVGHVINYMPSLGAYQPQVTPKNVQAEVTRGIVNGQTFQILNVGSLAATYQLSASCGAFTVCQLDKTTLTVAPGARDSARVTFLVPTAIGSFSPIKLVARYSSPTGGAAADSGTITVHTPTAYQLFQPRVVATFPLMILQAGWIPYLAYTITNTGSETATYTLTITMPSDYSFSPPHIPLQSITLAPGASYYMDVQPKTTIVPNRSDAVSLRASFTASDGTTVTAIDSSIVNTRDGIARIRITTLSSRTMSVPRGYSSSLGGTFAVQNVGTYALNVTLGPPSCTNLLTSCTAPASVYVDIGKSVNVPVSFKLGLSPDSVGTFTLSGTAMGLTGPATTSQDSIRVQVGSFRGISVTPDSAWMRVPTGDVGKQFLAIHNNGGVATVYRYMTSCRDVQGQFFVNTQTCSDSGWTTSIVPGDSAVVPVKYTAVSSLGQVGSLTLVAWDSSDNRITTQGRVFLQTAQLLPLAVSVAQSGATTTIARNQCLTIKAGDDAAYECGDLRLVHALPATTTMSRTRQPTLIYNSREHSGLILFPADVAVNSGAAVTQLSARITIAGQAPETTTFAWSSQWSSRSTMRIVVPFHAREKGLQTGAYHYTLSVDGITGGAPLSNQDTGTVAVVNRSKSEFGPGWWLDGYERLVFTSLPGRILWVGGDGSTRLYTQIGTSNVWRVMPDLDRPDSLVSANGFWYRRLRNGAYVMFNSAGLHSATVDSKQRVTAFNHEDATHPTWLTSIALPVPIGSSATRRYVFNHDAASGVVTSIDAPGVPARRIVVQYGLAQSGDSVVTKIVDADAVHGVGFTYASPGRLTTRTDRRGFSTFFVFDATSGGFLGDTLFMAGTAANNIGLGFCGAETASLSACARGPIDVSSIVTRFDGPRLNTDALDSAWFRITRFGAPSVVTDALKNVTRIERGDPNWPLLVTKTVDPVGFITTASYDSVRALLRSTTALNPRIIVGTVGIDSSATTTYDWHAKWDVVTQVESPTRFTTHYDYDTPSGDLLSQHVGSGTQRKVDYGYDPATRLVNAVTTRTSPMPTRYFYDALGNMDTTKTPLGFVSIVDRDYVGRDSVVRTPIEDPVVNWRRQTYQYDINDRLRVTTDSGKSTTANSAMKLTVLSDYDDEGNLTSVTRRAWPDSLNLGDLVMTSVYDGANRKRSDDDPYRGTVRSWTYDPAGNATTTVRGTDASTADYDALNRVTHRVVSGVPNSFTPQAASDDQHFYYDARGAMTQATNRYAEVHRTYNLAGAIVYDTSIVYAAQLATPTVNRHFYGITYSYDLDGRRRSMLPPTNLSVLSPLSYTYDQETGDLATVSVQSGGSFRYVYTNAGLLDSLIQADGTAERHYYDDDGREYRRTEYSPVLRQMLHDETVGLDARGRRLAVSSGGIAWAPTEDYTYDGLDGVMSASGRSVESTPRDPFGNALRRDNNTEIWTEHYLYEPHSTRMHFLSRQLSTNQWFDTLSHSYNLAGDLAMALDQITGPQSCSNGQGRADVDCPPTPRHLIAQSLLHNAYDADGHLLLAIKETTNDESGTWVPVEVRDPNWFQVYPAFERGVTEEYRYDPLGRRIWVHAHRDAYCPTQRDRDSTSVCLSTIERTIYDGDQVIAEIRQPGDTSASVGQLESDGSATGGPIQHFGQVGYVHGLGIDRPLELWRNYGGTPIRLVTHYQWQGALEIGTTLQGQLIQCGMTGAISPCEDIDWPGAKMRFGFVWPNRLLGPPSWWGTMAGMKENATGMRDMRNRQYDPKTGRFTQEDPIGLAGGMNLYGFASGDAVNFSDPLGLCPNEDSNCLAIRAAYEGIGAAAGFWFGGGPGVLATVTSGGLAAPVAVAATALTTGLGAAVGGLIGEIVYAATSSTSGNSPAAQKGQSEHKAYYDRMKSQGYTTNSSIPGTRLRPDAIDPENGIIRELKPNSPSGIARGLPQLQKYQAAAEKYWGKTFRTILDLYQP